MPQIDFRRSVLATAITATLITSGCGGGNGSDSDSPGTTATISGVVADGYLVGATVCLDVNENKICDAGEPRTTTIADGAYTLNDVENPNFPVVVEVDASTVDQDTGNPVGAPYVLTAPAGNPEFVSPLTTMVQSVLESNPSLSVEQAEDVVKGDLGYAADSDVDLFEDYVEAKNDTSNVNSAEYARLHKIAQVVAQVMEDNFEQIEQDAVNAGLDTDQVLDSLVAILVEEVLDQLEEIAEQADDPDTTIEDVASNTVGTIDTTTIADDVTEKELSEGIEATAMQSIVQAGVNWIEGEQEQTTVEFDRGRVSLNNEGNALVEVMYEYDGGAFVEYVEDEIEYTLGPNGLFAWTDTLTGGVVTFNADGSATVSYSDGKYVERVTASSLDVSGQPIVAFLSGEDHEAVADAIDPETATFATGSMAYRWTSSVSNTYYELFENCIMLNSSCATSLDQLISSVPWVDDGLSDPSEFYIGYDNGTQTGITVELLDDGTAKYYLLDFVNRNPVTDYHSISLLASGTWSTQNVYGETLLIAEIPGSIMERTELSWRDSNKIIAAVAGGFLREGEEIPAGEVDIDEDWTFNDSAMQSILDHFNP